MIHLTRATVADIAPFIARQFQSGGRKLGYTRLFTQLLVGPAWAARLSPEQAPVVLGGIVCLGDQPSEAWSVMVDGLGDNTRSLALQLRQVLREQALAHPGIVCKVRHDNASGHRLARVLGFQLVEAGGYVSVWRFPDVPAAHPSPALAAATA
jgi:hypothetical protein